MGSETIHPDTFNYFLPFSFSHNLFSDNFREIILMRRGIHEEEWKEFRVLKLTDKQGVGCQYTLKMDENGLISQSATSRIFWRLHVVETKTDLSVEFNEIDGKEIVEASWKDELGKPGFVFDFHI
uniref:Phenolic acid decarboxylase n=1 Tax=Panagrolaimus sp. JU765 TaxID=591449 RepID=A0AC34PVN3_9BILA